MSKAFPILMEYEVCRKVNCVVIVEALQVVCNMVDSIKENRELQVSHGSFDG